MPVLKNGGPCPKEGAEDILIRHSTEEGWDMLERCSLLLDYIEEVIAGRRISLSDLDVFLKARRTWSIAGRDHWG